MFLKGFYDKDLKNLPFYRVTKRWQKW
jgi:hypothetical protein